MKFGFVARGRGGCPDEKQRETSGRPQPSMAPSLFRPASPQPFVRVSTTPPPHRSIGSSTIICLYAVRAGDSASGLFLAVELCLCYT